MRRSDGERICETVGRMIGELTARVRRLEESQLRFLGVHQAGRSYQANSLVVRQGGLWVALEATTGTPGSSTHWQLAVKSGEANR
jgi:hypothetical protein